MFGCLCMRELLIGVTLHLVDSKSTSGGTDTNSSKFTLSTTNWHQFAPSSSGAINYHGLREREREGDREREGERKRKENSNLPYPPPPI